MKLLNRISLIFFATAIFAGCKKIDFVTNDVTGETIKAFSLIAPANNSSIVLNAALPNEKIEITWSAANPGVKDSVKYRWIATMRGTNNFDQLNRVLEIPSDNGGRDTKLTLTYRQLDDALKAKSFAAAQNVELLWTIEADNGTSKTLASNSFVLSVRRMADGGATPFQLFSPVSSATPVTINPGSTTSNLSFNWTRSLPATGGSVKYQILFAERKLDGNGNELPVNWNTPLFRINSNNLGVDTFAKVSYKAISDSLTKYGFTNPASAANLLWTVVATSGTWNQFANFPNILSIIREVKMYIVGSATPGDWDILKSIRMIEDKRNPGAFYLYVFLKAGELKFVNGQQWPPAPGAVDYGQKKSAPAGELTESDEENVPVAAPGVYRVTVDVTNMKYYLQTAVANGIGGMGMIGGFQTPQWSQPAVKMDYITVNRFNYLTNMNNGDGFKFHDGNDWDNSGPGKHRWYGLHKTTRAFGEDPGDYDDIKYNGTSGLVRAIWDATDVTNLRYTLVPGKLYAIGGDANLGNWDNSPGNASMPEFTYLGNGRWSATITVSSGAPFKLVVEKGNWDIQWGAGATAGSMQHRYYDADPPTFNFPAAGTYTVVVDEYAGTISW